jgi:SNF2 family DNA or RNA helicase
MQQAANHVCWFGLTWNLEEYHQLVRRVWRQGQKEKVIVHHLIAKDTMDEVVLEALRGKDRTQSGLLSQLKAYAEAHVKD